MYFELIILTNYVDACISEHIDVREAKNLFEANYSCIFYIFNDALTSAENNLRQRGKSCISIGYLHKKHCGM